MAKLYVVGIGPGDPNQMTGEALAALDEADVFCGYSTYLDLVRDLFPGKATYETPMRGEAGRCQWALDAAIAGRTVALLSSGDAGVYGMASLVLELAGESIEPEIEIVPGVTAALSGAAVLGAPLGHDFCCISLSDLLTPWETIERRLTAAAQGDFVTVLYNPASRTRTDHLSRACDVLLQYQEPDVVCGWVRNIGRPHQDSRILTLIELRDEELDMLCTVFVGSSETQLIAERMVTPRGYEQRS